MQTKAAGAAIAALFLAGCAATTPPPRFSVVSPADAEGPDAATPPPAPALSGEPEAHAPEPPSPQPGSPDQEYACPMHPERKQSSAGSCAACGMNLVRQKGAKEQP